MRHCLWRENHLQKLPILRLGADLEKKKKKVHVCIFNQVAFLICLPAAGIKTMSAQYKLWQQSFSAAEFKTWSHKDLCWHNPWDSELWYKGLGEVNFLVSFAAAACVSWKHAKATCEATWQ